MGLSNVLVYKEHINALYTQFGKKLDAFSFLLGLRMEDSKIVVDQRTINDFNEKNTLISFPLSIYPMSLAKVKA